MRIIILSCWKPLGPHFYVFPVWIYSAGVLIVFLTLAASAQGPTTNVPVAGSNLLALSFSEGRNTAPVVWEGGQDSGSLGHPRGCGMEYRAGYRWDLPVDLSDQGDVSAQHIGAGMTTRLPWNKALIVSLDVDVDYVSYSFSVDEDSLFDTPGLMRHAADVRIGPMLAGRINKRWSWMAKVTGAFTGETDADAWKSFNAGMLAGAGYTVNPKLKLVLAVVTSSMLADQPLVFPIIGFDWMPNDRLRVATRGPGLDIIMKLTPETTLTVKGRWEYRRYHLDEDRAPEPGGIFRDQRVNAGIELSRRFYRRVELTLEAGTSVYQQFKLENSDEDTIERINTDPEAYLGAKVSVNL